MLVPALVQALVLVPAQGQASVLALVLAPTQASVLASLVQAQAAVSAQAQASVLATVLVQGMALVPSRAPAQAPTSVLPRALALELVASGGW